MRRLEDFLTGWKHQLLRDTDLEANLGLTDGQRYGLVNRALKKGLLTKLRRGLYLINPPYHQISPHPFEIAPAIYGPSYVSFESALAYHGWIPEAIQETLSASGKRSKVFKSAIGDFKYLHVPLFNLYFGVQQEDDGEHRFLIASPWKAIADHFYVHKRPWFNLSDLELDLRVEAESMRESNLDTLALLSKNYSSPRVKKLLTAIHKEILSP